MKESLTKFGAKWVFRTLGMYFLGPSGFVIGDIAAQQLAENAGIVLPSFAKKFLETEREQFEEILGDRFESLADSVFKQKDSRINFQLAKAIVKVWEENLTRSLPRNRVPDVKILLLHDDFSRQRTELVALWRDKLKEAQEDKGEVLLMQLFESSSEIRNNTDASLLEVIQDETQIEDIFWRNLERTLLDWAKDAGICPVEWSREIPEPEKGKVKEFFCGNLRAGINKIFVENEEFRESFSYSIELYTADLIKSSKREIVDEIKLFGRELKEQLDRIESKTEQTLQLITHEKITRSLRVVESKPYLDEVLEYLRRVAENAVELKMYFPEHLKVTADGKTPFDRIRQRVQVAEKKDWDEIKARIAEQNRARGGDAAEDEGRAYRHLNAGVLAREGERTETPRVLDWDEKASGEFKRAIIVADPGFGKTWLLCYEARRSALNSIEQLKSGEATVETVALPILTRLSMLAQKHRDGNKLSQTLVQLAARVEDENSFSETFRKYLAWRLEKESNCVVFLDAMDEVPQKPARGLSKEELRRKLEEFSKVKSNISIYLTSRIVGYDGMNIANAKELEILPFDDEQIRSFVGVWFIGAEEKTESFVEMLEQQPQTAGLAQIPLMLSLLCKLFDFKQPEEFFPTTRCQIYGECLRGLLKDWKDNNDRESISEERLNIRLGVLRQLAFKLFKKQNEQFSDKSFTNVLMETLGINVNVPSAEDAVDEFKRRLESDGIIKKAIKGESPEYLFLHLTFQEYLTASYIAESPDWRKLVVQDKIIFNPRWREVLTLLGGTLSADDVQEYIETLLALNGENGEGDMLFRPFTLAMLASKEAADKISVEYKTDLIEKAVEKFLNPPEFQLREKFQPVVQNWGNDLLDFVLSRAAGKEGINKENALSLLSGTNIINSRRNAVRMMQFIRDFVGKKPVAEEVLHWGMEFREISLHLGKEILEIVKSHMSDDYTQQCLAYLFGKIPTMNAELGKEIIRFIKEGSYLKTSKYFAYALGTLKDVDREIFDDALQVLEMKRQHLHTKRNISYVLTNLKEIDAGDGKRLLAILEDAHDSYVSRNVAEALSRLKEPDTEINARLVEIIKDKNSDLQMVNCARYILSKPSKSESGASDTNRDEDDGDEAFAEDDERSRAIESELAGLLRDRGALSIIRSSSFNISIRRRAAGKIGALKQVDAETGIALLALVKDKTLDLVLRQEIAFAFKSLKKLDTQIGVHMIGIVKDRNQSDFIRAQVAEGLKNLRELNEEMAIEVFRLVKEPNQTDIVRSRLAEVLVTVKKVHTETWLEIYDYFKDTRLPDGFRDTLLDLLRNVRTKDSEEARVIEAVRDFVKLPKRGSYFTEDTIGHLNLLLALANRFKCPVPSEGEIIIKRD